MKYRILGFAAGLSLLVGIGESAALEVTWLDSRHLDTTVDRTSRLEVRRRSVEERIPGHFLLVYKMTNVTGDAVRPEQVVVDVLPSNSDACLAPIAGANTCPLEPRRTEFRDADPTSPPASDDRCLWTYEFAIPVGVQIEPMLVYSVTDGQGVQTAAASAQIDVGDAGVHPLYWRRAVANASDTRAMMTGINLDRVENLALITREGEPISLEILSATESKIEFGLPPASLTTECCFALRTSSVKS